MLARRSITLTIRIRLRISCIHCPDMPLDLEAIRRIAMLARIDVSDAEAIVVCDQLNNILHMIETMQAVNTEGVEPMSHAQDVTLRLREDIVSETDRHAAFQAIAPQVECDLYLVPKVIE